jgi:phosphatidylserine/phosphatidylglycerophosphate/cardiolipin synthase-like enzyme
MKKLVRAFIALTLMVLGVVVVVPPAQAADPPCPSLQSSYTPPEGALFNIPVGARSQQLALMKPIMDAVNSVPAGSYIRFVTYSFSYQCMADALIVAHKRGVNVRLLIDSHTETDAIRQLRSALKVSTGKGNTSYLKTCQYSCMSDKPSYIHSKLYLFSRVGNARYVSMISSANPAETGISRSWNNTYTIPNNKTIYDGNVDSFNDMLPDKTNTDYYHTVSSSPYKMYYYPRAGSTPSSDTFYNILSDVTCTGASAGYGNSNRRTEIKISMYVWTSLRLYLAQKLTELKGKGCDIEVVYPSDQIDPKVTAELLKKDIKIYDGRIDANGDGVKELYPHSKYLLINGVYQGDSTFKGVYTASQNFTNNSLRRSNEVMLRIPTDAVYGEYARNFGVMKDNTVSVDSVAQTTLRVQSAEDTALRDSAPDPDE